MIGAIGNVGSAAGYSAANFTQGLSAIRAQWKTTLSLRALGDLAQDGDGVSPYSLNPAAAMAMDSLASDLAVQTQSLLGAGYAEAKAAEVDSSLARVNDLLTTVQVDILAMADGTLTDSQKTIKQAEVNAALQSIDLVGRMTSFAGQKLLDGTAITYSPTTNPQDKIAFTPPNVNTGSLGGGTGKLADISTLLDEGKYDAAMKIAKDAQSAVRNGRADAGNFSNAVGIQKSMVLDQMTNTAALYNQASAAAYGGRSRSRSSITSSLLGMSTSNARYAIFQTLIGGMSR
jgi:flagellin-like hook-associated protein FlgL